MDQLSQAQFDTYVEEVCRHIAESSSMQRSRVDAYLDGGLNAASQVQDVRLSLLEQPAEVSGWDYWFDIAVVFLLESNVIGAVLKAATSAVFKPLLRSNHVWLRIPKSPAGNELVEIARRAESGLLIEPGRGRLTRESVLRRGAGGLPGRASKDALALYHSSIQELVHVLEPIEVAEGLAQTANQARTAAKPRRNDPLATSDSPGVTVVTAMQDYARLTRLGIEVRAARCTAFARSRAATPDLGDLSEGYLLEPLSTENAGVSLATIARRTALYTEALIWSQMYGFTLRDFSSAGRSGPGTPALGVNNDSPLTGIRVELVDYWLDRFGDEVAEWATKQAGWAEMPRRGRLARTIYLRGYFARIAADLLKTARPDSDSLRPIGASTP